MYYQDYIKDIDPNDLTPNQIKFKIFPFIILIIFGILIMLAFAMAFVLFVNYSQKKILKKQMHIQKLDYEHQQEQELTPLLETLEVLNEFVKAGKIRHYGLSNETPWGAMKYLQIAEQHQLPRAVSIQNPYNLLNRSYEIGLAEVSHREDIGLLAYSPMAFGALSGKYLGGKRPAGARLTLFDRFTRYTSSRAEQATQAYVNLAHQYALSPAQMALAFVNQRPFVTSNIIGATTMAQLQENIGSADIVLPTELYEALGQVHQDNPNPCP